MVVALPSEARPLIRRFGLVRSAAEALPVWRADGVSLAISGVGRESAVAAVDLLAADEEGSFEAAWLNVGIGGHRALAVGEVVLAHKVIERPGGRAWYPPLVFEPPCATATVTSVDRPETSYPEETVYEMEAAGFCSATARFASAELIQVVKVISDNAQTPPERLTADRVEELIEGQLEAIVQIVEQTATLAGEIDARRQPPPALRGFTERWRFTTTQRRQLERLLRRLAALEPASPTATDFSDRTSAQAVIAALASRLAAHPPGLG